MKLLFYIYKALFRCHVSRVLFCLCVVTQTNFCLCVCVVTQTNFCLCVCVVTLQGGQIGERDSVSEAKKYVSEANRYVGEARKRPAGARIWGP